MRVKRFVADDIQEAMAKIKSEMGSEAVILHTRHFKEGGILGLFKKNYVEVTAATDNSNNNIQEKLNIPKNISGNTSSHFTSNQPGMIVEKSWSKTPLDINEALSTVSDLKEMKNLMSDMSILVENVKQKPHFSRLGKSLLSRLLKQEVDEKIANKIVKATLQQLTLQPYLQEEQVNSILYANLLKPIKNKSKPIVFGKSRLRMPKVYAIIGPTGVGKTTTIAKMAAMYALIEHKKISFITVDTYRIAAADQLKTIGEIMNVPVNVVYSLNQLKECMMEMSDSEIIFIDTAGSSHKNTAQIDELRSYLEIANPDETFLTLSCTSKYQDLIQIIEAYYELNVSRLIFTKLDETSFYGSIYNIASRYKYPLSYFTTGQNIPDDIEIADPKTLVQLLIKE